MLYAQLLEFSSPGSFIAFLTRRRGLDPSQQQEQQRQDTWLLRGVEVRELVFRLSSFNCQGRRADLSDIPPFFSSHTQIVVAAPNAVSRSSDAELDMLAKHVNGILLSGPFFMARDTFPCVSTLPLCQMTSSKMSVGCSL